MKIKLYILASIIYMVLLGALVFHLNSDNYTVEFGSYIINLPIVIWVLIPVFLLFIASFVHMSFYSLLRFIKYKHFFDDASKFEAFVKDLLLEKTPKLNFKTKEFKNAAELTQSLKMQRKLNGFDSFNEGIDLLNELKEGKGLSLKKFKLDEDNPIFVANEKNLIKNDLNYAYSKIRHKKEAHDEIDELAFEEVLKKGNEEQIKTLRFPKSAAQSLELIQRFENDSLKLSPSEYEHIISSTSFDEKAYLQIAKLSVKKLDPDALIAIFRRLKSTHLEALRGYLFILAELALFDELRLELSNTQKGFDDFKIVLMARENNIKIDLYKIIQ
ncbi:hypothetical protein [Campylobacter troglodytis]|uniref:hypothetical protein n=1 Tax=Campylobacter troglodytis TaxID=654363 RepID=UPI0011577371|nr:hypothetical protein [Campylobacter troglodytis]TQR59020.1 hypothetical protein DMC01_07480 [Campylobacter troglodytis]